MRRDAAGNSCSRQYGVGSPLEELRGNGGLTAAWRTIKVNVFIGTYWRLKTLVSHLQEKPKM